MVKHVSFGGIKEIGVGEYDEYLNRIQKFCLDSVRFKENLRNTSR